MVNDQILVQFISSIIRRVGCRKVAYLHSFYSLEQLVCQMIYGQINLLRFHFNLFFPIQILRAFIHLDITVNKCMFSRIKAHFDMI